MKRVGLVVGLLGLIAVGSVGAQEPINHEEKLVFPLSIYASAFQSDGKEHNPPRNVVDGNLKTRWSAQGDPQVLTVEVPLDYYTRVCLAFWQNGKKNRISTFDVFISDGPFGITSHYALAGVQSSANEKLTCYQINAGYGMNEYPFVSTISIFGHGNNANDWNSILEMEVYAAILD